MNANRNHALRPTSLTLADRNRQHIAIARHERQLRANARGNAIKAVLGWGFIIALTAVFFAPALRAIALGVL